MISMFFEFIEGNNEIIAAMTAVVYSITGIFFLTLRKENREKRKNHFFHVLLAGLETGAVNSYDDLINIYKGVNRITSEEINYRYNLSNWLRQFLVKIICDYNNANREKELNQYKERIKEFIEINDKESPYSDFPDAERSILTDIASYLKIKDTVSVTRKIEELSGIIKTRYEEHKKLQKSNRWSIPLAVVGIILSVVFGIAPLFS